MAITFYAFFVYRLNPALEETYTTIEHILSDVHTALGDGVRIHLGGDEVSCCHCGHHNMHANGVLQLPGRTMMSAVCCRC